MTSLTARVSLIAAAVLVVFVALTAFALDRGFRESAERAERERLFARLYLVMADAELDGDGTLVMPTDLGEARLGLPGSGLYAQVRDGRGQALWHSPSALGLQLPPPSGGPLEQFRRRAVGGNDYFVASLRVRWETGGRDHPLTFAVYEDLTEFERQLSGYRNNLWGWLGAMSLLLLLSQAGALTWGLRPLRRVTGEIRRIEHGEQSAIEGDYPRELRRLTASINTLLHHERGQLARYRDALADLAHSLKTPLAVLRGIQVDNDEAARTLEEQVVRMDGIVQHQLARAATAGRSAMVAPVPIAPLVERLLTSLHKVYRDHGVTVIRDFAADADFRGDEGDLLELLGNLLDNAFKWSRSRIRVSVGCAGDGVAIVVEDDGPGIPEEAASRVLERGVRLDQATPGHGLGLAMVADLVHAYRGRLEFGPSDLGGAGVRLELPGCRRL
ncbi:ATP-binding protein [Endothiovibrio diazotrophicus]